MSSATPKIAFDFAKSVKSQYPTLSQIYGTLRICLRYNASSANIFTRIMNLLEITDFIPILALLPHDELQRLLNMIAARLTRIRLDVAEIAKLSAHCVATGVTELPLILRCELFQSKPSGDQVQSERPLQVLGQLLPNLEVLQMHDFIDGHFPANMKRLRALMLRQSTSQRLLEEICENCPQLEQLLLRNEEAPHTTLDVGSITKCKQMRELQVPLMLRKPVTLCNLRHLVHLTLQRLQLWPEVEWLPVFKDIISAKRYELRSLSIDGSWLTTRLDVSMLNLHNCWSLKQLQLVNCKLSDRTKKQFKLPLSCQQLTMKSCTLCRLPSYLKNNAHLRLLEYLDCRESKGSDQLLHQLLKQRQNLPIVSPLTLHFSQSTPLRRELTGLNRTVRLAWEEWLKVREVHGDLPMWNKSVGTIVMTFGHPINYMPDLNRLNDSSEPTPAELVRDLDMADDAI